MSKYLLFVRQPRYNNQKIVDRVGRKSSFLAVRRAGTSLRW